MKEILVPKITADAVSVFFKDRQKEYRLFEKQQQATIDFYTDLIDKYLDQGIMIENKPNARTGRNLLWVISKGIETPSSIRVSVFLKLNGELLATNHKEYETLDELFDKELVNIRNYMNETVHCYIPDENGEEIELER